jgi:hypothetical protein
MTTKTKFTPFASLITEDAEFSDAGRTCVDPSRVTLLHFDGIDNMGWLYTKDEWENDKEPRIHRDYGGTYTGLNDGERVELLPDMCVVKLDERDYWIDDMILANTSRIYGVYCFDRRLHVHCCSLEASYELTFLGTEWEPSRELTDEEDEATADAIRRGDADDQSIRYFAVRDMERVLENVCEKGWLPKKGNGGYPIDVSAVTTDDAIEEIREVYNTSTL